MSAGEPPVVVVLGAKGQTGRRIVDRALASGFKVIATVRGSGDATAADFDFPDSSLLQVQRMDVVKNSREELTQLLRNAGTDVAALVVATGFSPGFPPDPAGAVKVDWAGTVKAFDSAQDAGNVQRFVLVSSLLTNGLAAGEGLNPQYLLLNAFGGVLLAKNAAERYIQSRSQSGLDFTIIRPGGLSNEARAGDILFSAADTLFGGSIERDQVAATVVAAIQSPDARNKIVEIIQSETASPLSFQEGFASVPPARRS